MLALPEEGVGVSGGRTDEGSRRAGTSDATVSASAQTNVWAAASAADAAGAVSSSLRLSGSSDCRITASSAIPSSAPTRWTISSALAARATACGASTVYAAAIAGISVAPIPMPLRNRPPISNACGASTNTNGMVPRITSATPGRTTWPAPSRSVSFPATGIVTIAPRPWTPRIRPVPNALWSRATWK